MGLQIAEGLEVVAGDTSSGKTTQLLFLCRTRDAHLSSSRHLHIKNIH